MMKRLLALTLVSFSLVLIPLNVPQTIAFSTGAQASLQDDGEFTFRLRGIDGKMYDVAQMRGHVLLVSFGATWCQPCLAELRALEELKKEYSNKPVKFMWASIEGEEVSDGKLRDFAKGLKLTFPVVRDSDRYTYAQFSDRSRIPLVVFFDKQGNFVRPAHVGMSSPEMYKNRMRGMLDKLLAQAVTNNAGGAPQKVQAGAQAAQPNTVTGQQTRPRTVTRPVN